MTNTKFASAGNYPAGSDDWSNQPRQVELTNSEAAEGFAPNTPIPPEVLNYLFAACFPDVSTYPTSAVWTKPENAQLIEFLIVGPGGHGGINGGMGSGGAGGGGGSGQIVRLSIEASLVPATLTVEPGIVGDALATVSNGAFSLSALAGSAGGNGGSGSGLGGDGGGVPDPTAGDGGKGGNGSVGQGGTALANWASSSGGGGGGDGAFAGGNGGPGVFSAGGLGGISFTAEPGEGGLGYGAGGGGCGAPTGGGGGGGGASGYGTDALAKRGPDGGLGVGQTGEGAPGYVRITTWRGIP